VDRKEKNMSHSPGKKYKDCPCADSSSTGGPGHTQPSGNCYSVFANLHDPFMPCQKHEKYYDNPSFFKLPPEMTWKNMPYDHDKYYKVGPLYDFLQYAIPDTIPEELQQELNQLYVSPPYTNPETIKPKTDSIGSKSGLYHLIYTYGNRTSHFVTQADSEKDAKEKIIKQYSRSFSSHFPEEINDLKAHKVAKDVLQVYEKT
jgi:hypothetical protein